MINFETTAFEMAAFLEDNFLDAFCHAESNDFYLFSYIRSIC